MRTLQLSRQSKAIAGILLLTVVAVESGGYYMTLVVRGTVELTDFQHAFSRAGHAHAGVLVVLGLVSLLLADAANLRGLTGWLARLGVPAAAVLMSSGFFLSSLGEGRDEPSGLIVLIWIGAVALAAGVITLGVGLLRGAMRGPANIE